MIAIARRTCAVILMLAATLSAPGCGTDDRSRESKREYDRTMMRLQDADKEKAQMQAQIDQLKANLETASARSRAAQNDVATMQNKLTQTQQQLSTAQANTVAANQMQQKLADLQVQNQKLSAEVQALQQQLSAAKERAPASTMPTMNK